MSLPAWLCRHGGIDESLLAQALAEEYGLPFASVIQPLVPSAAPWNSIPASAWQEHRVIILRLEGGYLQVAVDNPFNEKGLVWLREASGCELELTVATASAVEAALGEVYLYIQERDKGIRATKSSKHDELHALVATPHLTIRDPRFSPGGDEPMIKLVETLISDAIARRASDIHLEPMAGAFRVRNRIDGEMVTIESRPRELHGPVISRVKILAQLSIAEKRIPQDGRIRWRRGDSVVDLRVSCLPTSRGESIVMRILDGGSARLTLEDLGMNADDRERWQRLYAKGEGMILVTGPTGSGKTTTLYSVLNVLNQTRRKIVTVEDPVEYEFSGINQVAVHAQTGMTFARALRALLRQAPNVVMVGEIRDGETAGIAAHAALTGHLVLSTLHTNDACGAITRLLDLGVKPLLISASLRGVLAQRLVRRVCPGCSQWRTATARERTILSQPGGAESLAVAQGTGCPRCRGTGFHGRVGLFELLVIDDDLRVLLSNPEAQTAFRNAWKAKGGRSLREDGLCKVRMGLTTLDEVESVVTAESPGRN